MPRTAAISNLSVVDLQRMIDRRHSEMRKLEKQRAKWQKKVDAVDREIAALGGAPGRGGRGGGRGVGSRARNEMSLPDVIAQVLTRAGGPAAVGDIMDGVLAAGYRSNSANFRGIVNQALIKDKRFTSAARGQYQIKAGKAAGGKAARKRGAGGKKRGGEAAAAPGADAPGE
jgi:hypothetical protein